MDLIGGFALSFILTSLLYILRTPQEYLSKVGETKTELIIGWCIIVFSIILGFTIVNFYNRYIEIRNILVNEIVNLQIIYRTFDKFDNSEVVLESIRNYVESVLNDLQYSLQNDVYSKKTELLYRKMDNSIISYFNDHRDNTFISTINSRLSTSQRIKVIIDQEIVTGNFYINILWLLFALILIPLYFAKMPNKIIQFIIEFCLLSIFITGIVLCGFINNPFVESPVTLKFTMYSDLLDEMGGFN